MADFNYNKYKKGGLERIKIVEDVLHEAYSLGYEVGYYNHDEFVGWVSKKREELLKKSQLYQIEIEYENQYEKGKNEGKRVALNDRTTMMSGTTGEEEEEKGHISNEENFDAVTDAPIGLANSIKIGNRLSRPRALKRRKL